MHFFKHTSVVMLAYCMYYYVATAQEKLGHCLIAGEETLKGNFIKSEEFL